MPESLPLLMDRAYEGNQTRQLVLNLGMTPVFRRIFSRFEKLDVVFLAFLSFALIVEALSLV